MIAVHAAGTGVAWVKSAVRTFLPVLERRYAGTSPAAQAAANNIIAVSARVKETIDVYVASGRLTEAQGRVALDDPAFAVLLNDRLLDASETDDPLVHDAFAKMVVERMTMTSGTAEAILIGVASARVRDLGNRQLRLLGTIFVAEQVYIDAFDSHGSREADFEYYTAQCNVEVRPFWDFPVLSQDIDHLDAANLLELSEERLHRRTIGGGRQSPMLANALANYPDQLNPQTPAPDVYRKLHA